MFWCQKPLSQRAKRVVYVARFIPAKRHEILKQIATDLPQFEFISVGGLIEAEKTWFERFSQNLPQNYTLKTNLPTTELLELLQDSRVYVHLMEGEHFGIAPVEGLASGCVTLVHDSGGMKEFIPQEYRWQSIDDLKEKLERYIEAEKLWEFKRKELWSRISTLTPEVFQEKIWAALQNIDTT